MESLYLPSLYIKGFKSIEEMNLESLSAINLIAGDNNVGKSTILEAIYAFAANGHPESFIQMALHRMNANKNEALISDYIERRQLMLQFFNRLEFESGKSIILQTSSNRKVNLTLGYVLIEDVKTEKGVFPKKSFYR